MILNFCVYIYFEEYVIDYVYLMIVLCMLLLYIVYFDFDVENELDENCYERVMCI